MTDYSVYHVLFPPEGYLLGIDSRYWNGKIPPGFPKIYLAGVKLTDLFIPGDHISDEASAQVQGCRDNGIEPLPFHWFSYRSSGVLPEKAGKDQADLFWDAMVALGVDDGPHCADVEDQPSYVGLRTVTALRAFDMRLVERQVGRTSIYTAPWFWDPKMKPYADFYGDWSPYDNDLWVSDPDPVDNHLPGKWTKWVIRQLKLDWSCPGFNAKIDVNWVSKAWFDSAYGTAPTQPLPPVPPPPSGPVPVTVSFPAGKVDLTVEQT